MTTNACASVAPASMVRSNTSPDTSAVPVRRLIMSPVQSPLPVLSTAMAQPSVVEAPVAVMTNACAATAVPPRATLIPSPVSATAPKFKSIMLPDVAAVEVVISSTLLAAPPTMLMSMTFANVSSAPEELIWKIAAASVAEPVVAVVISMIASVRAPSATSTTKAPAPSASLSVKFKMSATELMVSATSTFMTLPPVALIPFTATLMSAPDPVSSVLMSI